MLENLGKNLPKELRNYIREVESKSGIKIPEEQRALLAKDLRDNVYRKLEKETYDDHTRQFKGIKDRLIGEWEKMGGDVKVREWPQVLKFDKAGKPVISSETGLQEAVKHQAHHITPQQLGGKHEWWNIHPVEQSVHQGGVHGSGSVLSSIVKGLE